MLLDFSVFVEKPALIRYLY